MSDPPCFPVAPVMSTAGILDRLNIGVGDSGDYATLRMGPGWTLFVSESAFLGRDAATRYVGHAEIEVATFGHWEGKSFPNIA